LQFQVGSIKRLRRHNSSTQYQPDVFRVSLRKQSAFYNLAN